MRVLFIVCFLGLLVLALGGCRFHSTIDLDNPEFPRYKIRPWDLSEKLLEKYSVGNVIVEPRIWFSHQTVKNPVKTYHLGVLFFSKTNTSSAVVSSVSVLLNGKEFPYGNELIGRPSTDWKVSPEDSTFYIRSVEGEPIDQPETSLLKARVDVSLVVEVMDKRGEATKKQIDTYFVPKKRRQFKW